MRVCLYSLANMDETGYGGMLRHFTLALMSRGVDVVDFQFTKEADIQVYIGQPSETLRKYRTRSRQFNLLRRKAPIFLIYTMFETGMAPTFWTETINKTFDGVITPSKWCAQLFKESSVSVPVYQVPLGVDPKAFPYLQREKRDSYTLLWQGLYFGDRKGRDLFRRAASELDGKEIPNLRIIEKAAPIVKGMDAHYMVSPGMKIMSIVQVIPHLEMIYLLKMADLSVNPTSGEGFGLLPLEHMATGLPTIVSDNSGCKEYINSDYNLPIDCHLVQSYFSDYNQFGLEERPDYNHLKELIIQAYQHREEMAEMGRRASDWVHQNWTWDQAADKLLEVIKDVSG